MDDLLKAFKILRKYKDPISFRINSMPDTLKSRMSIHGVPVSDITKEDVLELKNCGWDGKGEIIYLDIEL